MYQLYATSLSQPHKDYRIVDPWSFAITGGLSIVSQPKVIQKLVALTRRKRKILVLGASGAGKTQLIRSLKEDVVASIPPSERTLFSTRTRIVLKNISFLFSDTPGLVTHKGARRRALQEAIKSHVFGIINVVCFGYHEGEAETKYVIRRSSGKDLVRVPYLKERRSVELSRLSEWLPLVDNNVTDWVITVVTKADLWWPHQGAAVYDHYERGPYSKTLGKLEVLVSHSVVPYCSVIEPFYRRVAPGGLGNTEKRRMRNYLLTQLLSAAVK